MERVAGDALKSSTHDNNNNVDMVNISQYLEAL